MNRRIKGSIFDRLTESTTVKFDSESGIGAVPDNENVDYLGFTAIMKPSIFLKMALKAARVDSSQYLQQQILSGKSIAPPFLIIERGKDNNKVVGHEGRNRCDAILAIQGDVPIPVHMFFTQGIRARHLSEEILQQLNTGMINQNGNYINGPLFVSAKLNGKTYRY